MFALGSSSVAQPGALARSAGSRLRDFCKNASWKRTKPARAPHAQRTVCPGPKVTLRADCSVLTGRRRHIRSARAFYRADDLPTLLDRLRTPVQLLDISRFVQLVDCRF